MLWRHGTKWIDSKRQVGAVGVADAVIVIGFSYISVRLSSLETYCQHGRRYNVCTTLTRMGIPSGGYIPAQIGTLSGL